MNELINKLDKKILDIELKYLGSKVHGFPVDTIMSLGLKTIRDYLQYDFTPHFNPVAEVVFYHYYFDQFNKKLNANPQSFYDSAMKFQKREEQKILRAKQSIEKPIEKKIQTNQPYQPDQRILNINPQNLRGRIMGFSTAELKKLQIETVYDLLNFDLETYCLERKINRVQAAWIKDKTYFWYYRSNSKPAIANFFQTALRTSLISKIKYSGCYYLQQLGPKIPYALDPKILSMQLDELSEMLTLTLCKKLNELKVKTVKDLMELDLEHVFLIDNLGKLTVEKIIEFQEKFRNNPEFINKFLYGYDLTQEEKLKNETCLTNYIHEEIPDSNGNLVSRDLYFRSSLATLRTIIPEYLSTRLTNNNIKTIKDLLECKILQFPAEIQNDKKFCSMFLETRNDIINNPGKYKRISTPFYRSYVVMPKYSAFSHQIDVLEENRILMSMYDPIPLIPGIPETETPLGVLKTIINDYFQESKKEEDELNVLTMYYGIGEEKKNLSQIALIAKTYHNNYRRLFRKKLEEIGSLLQGKKIGNKSIFIRREAQILLTEPVRYITEKPLHIYVDLKKYFTFKLLETLDEEKENLLELLLNALGYYVIRPSINTHVMDTVVIKRKYYSMTFKSIIKELYSNIIRSPNGISQNQLYKKLHNKEKKVDSDLVNRLLNLFPMIETFEESGNLLYRRPPSEKKLNVDLVFNILTEKGEKMHKEEIISELNLRLEKSEKDLNHYLIQLLSHNKRFKPVGRTNYWILSKWKVNSDSQKKLIRKALLTINRPASIKEIVDEIHKIRPEVKYRSISSVISANYIPYKANTYILPEWKHRYPDIILKPKKEISDPGDWPSMIAIREKIVDILKRSETKKLRSSEICKIIRSDNPEIIPQIIFKIFSSKKYFKRSYDENNKLMIERK